MYTKGFDNHSLATFRQKVGKARHIAIISHTNADGDACGSLLGITLQLRKAATNAASISPILPNGCPHTFLWLPHASDILSGESQRELCDEAIAQADLLICVDLNTPSRTDFLQDDIVKASAFKVLIDHHHDPAEEHFDLVFSDPDISSACELVVWLSQALWKTKHMDSEVARCLYTGLRTDTGGFAFSCDQPSCWEAAAFLVDYDINPADVQNRIVNTFTFDRMRFYGFAIAERLLIFKGQKTAIFYFSLEDQRKYRVSGEDMEGLVNYTLMMEEIEVGALLREEPSRTKVSLRAKYDTDVRLIASQLGGGGHTKAAGATVEKPLEETLLWVKQLLGISFTQPSLLA